MGRMGANAGIGVIAEGTVDATWHAVDISGGTWKVGTIGGPIVIGNVAVLCGLSWVRSTTATGRVAGRVAACWWVRWVRWVRWLGRAGLDELDDSDDIDELNDVTGCGVIEVMGDVMGDHDDTSVGPWTPLLTSPMTSPPPPMALDCRTGPRIPLETGGLCCPVVAE